MTAPRAATLSRIDSIAHAENGRGWRTVEGTSAECAHAGERESPSARREVRDVGAAVSREESCSRAESSSPRIAVSALRAELSSR
eukprot:1820037-Pleurochrysis_carterae.AAC.1